MTALSRLNCLELRRLICLLMRLLEGLMALLELEGRLRTMVHLVVGGVLIDDGRILLGHRRADRRYYPDCWDVLGGHIETGETPEAALVRELREEAGVEAAVAGSPALHVEDDPLRDDGMILDVWIVTTWSGNPTNLAPDEHDELRWISLEELPRLPVAHPSYPPFLLDLLQTAPHN